MFRSFYIQDVKGIIRATTPSQIDLRKNRITYIMRSNNYHWPWNYFAPYAVLDADFLSVSLIYLSL